jgi:hypothetical protein
VLNLGLAIRSDDSIWHDSFVEDHVLDPGFFNASSPSQVASGQIGSIQASTDKRGIDELGIREVGATEARVIHRRSSQVSTSKVGTSKVNLPHGTVSQNSFTQIDFLHENLAKVSTTQIDPTQIGTSHIIDFQGESREVSFSGSVPPQQLFTVNPIFHDNLARISDSITTFWNRALAVDTPFDLQQSDSIRSTLSPDIGGLDRDYFF